MAGEYNANDRPFHSDEAANASLGRNGGLVIGDSTSVTGKWFALQAINDTVLTMDEDTGCVCEFVESLSLLEGITIPAGTILWGNWTRVQLVSGVVIMHNTVGGF